MSDAWTLIESQRLKDRVTAASLLRGRLYNRAKKAHGGDRRSESSGQNAHLIEPERTAERLAKAHDVDERTIRRDGEFAEAVEEPGLTLACHPAYLLAHLPV
jgi:hypothetical protein